MPGRAATPGRLIIWTTAGAPAGVARPLRCARERQRTCEPSGLRSTSLVTNGPGPSRETTRQPAGGFRLIVSEPLADLPGAWHELPESTALTVSPDGAHELSPFHPLSP
jgi:hypothetical protein